MTCIVGIAFDGRVTIGGDRCAGDPTYYNKFVTAEPKVFLKDKFLIGYTTSFRLGDVLQYHFTPPASIAYKSVSEYMRCDFVDEVRKVLTAAGWSKKENNKEEGGTFMVGVRGRLFVVQSNFSVLEYLSGVAVIGCGESYAYGSLETSEGILGWSVANSKDRVRWALEAAAKYSAYVSPPFDILEIHEEPT